VESPSKSLAVGAEEEQFEWWEVIRGLMHWNIQLSSN
jgi:hypothetical protein